MQPWKDRELLEIGYLFQRAFWHQGYATEAAKGCKSYAFEVLKAREVCSIIRDTNTPSQRVALRNGMVKTDTWVKHYRGVDMPHDRYVAVRESDSRPGNEKQKNEKGTEQKDETVDKDRDCGHGSLGADVRGADCRKAGRGGGMLCGR